MCSPYWLVNSNLSSYVDHLSDERRPSEWGTYLRIFHLFYHSIFFIGLFWVYIKRITGFNSCSQKIFVFSPIYTTFRVFLTRMWLDQSAFFLHRLQIVIPSWADRLMNCANNVHLVKCQLQRNSAAEPYHKSLLVLLKILCQVHLSCLFRKSNEAEYHNDKKIYRPDK